MSATMVGERTVAGLVRLCDGYRENFDRRDWRCNQSITVTPRFVERRVFTVNQEEIQTLGIPMVTGAYTSSTGAHGLLTVVELVNMVTPLHGVNIKWRKMSDTMHGLTAERG
jgi:hypothetical protein